MKVLSLFDGMACGMIAMNLAGVEVESYDAYEIDKYAVKTAQHNFSMIQEHGDVFSADFKQYGGVDFMVGGSPCTYWSIAQTKNRETVASGMGWELFSQYVRALHEAKPKYFIYENNKSMSKEIRTSIDKAFGFEAVCINSALVSAQNRQRLYWVGKRNDDGTYSKVDVKQPEDRGILLRDILETGIAWQEKSYNLTTRCNGAILSDTLKRHTHTMVAESVCVAAAVEYNPLHSCDVVVTDQNIRCTYKDGSGTAQGYTVTFDDVKSPSVIAGHAHKMKVIERVTDKKQIPVYEVRGGRITIKGKTYPIKLADGFYIIRKLTVTECKRLQTVPDTYAFPVSDTQAYKMLGNGWTCEIIAHLIRSTLNDSGEFNG